MGNLFLTNNAITHFVYLYLIATTQVLIKRVNTCPRAQNFTTWLARPNYSLQLIAHSAYSDGIFEHNRYFTLPHGF